MNRRGFLKDILALGVAPYVVTTAGVLMPVRPRVTVPAEFTCSVTTLDKPVMVTSFEDVGDWTPVRPARDYARTSFWSGDGWGGWVYWGSAVAGLRKTNSYTGETVALLPPIST